MAAAAGDLLAFGKGPAAHGAVDRHCGKDRALAVLAVTGAAIVAIGLGQALMAGDKSRIAHRMHAVRSAERNRQTAGRMAGGAFGDLAGMALNLGGREIVVGNISAAFRQYRPLSMGAAMAGFTGNSGMAFA